MNKSDNKEDFYLKDQEKQVRKRNKLKSKKYKNKKAYVEDKKESKWK